MAQASADLLKALDGAMEAERKARAFYLDASKKTSSERGRDLLRQLAAFEQTHFDRLSELKESLTGEGRYILYEGTDLSSITSEVPAETDQGKEENLENVLGILQVAIDAETEAAARYKKLAEETEDAAGREMFVRFAEEETNHRRILTDEYYHLTNKGGIWQWGD